MTRLTRKVIAFGCSLALLGGICLPTGVVEAASVEQTAHMEKVLKADSTYEGFLANEDTLTFEEIASLPNATIVSEYDKIVALKSLPVSELKELDMEETDIMILQTKSAKEIVLDHAATFSIDRLLEKGLSIETVQAIKAGEYKKVSNTEARLSSAEVSLGIGNASRAGTSCNYNIYWHWSDEPVFTYTDHIYAGIGSNYSLTTGCTALLYYEDEAGVVPPIDDQRITPKHLTSDTCRYDIPMRAYTSTGPQYCQAGKAFVGTEGNYIPSGAIVAHASYVHSQTREEAVIDWDFDIWGFSFSLRQETTLADISYDIW